MLVELVNTLFISLTVTNVVVIQFSYCVGTEEFKTVDVAKLSELEHGTELVLIESSYNDKRAYHIEDFFWTGSGDGDSDKENEDYWKTKTATTEYKTKTILSTVYIETPSTHVNQTLPSTTTNCPFNCDAPITPSGDISPTPTFEVPYSNTTETDVTGTDRHFWLLTVLKSEGKDIVIPDLKNGLARLYKIAFQRQQELHLGINARSKREVETDKPVNVYIHNVATLPINGEEKIEVLYHVAVSGQPVAATTAAADMSLVSDEEVTNELGYPFIIKAEPYLKVNDPQYLSSSNNTWVFIGVALTILFVLLLLVALLTLALSKHSKSQMGLLNKKQVFHHDSAAGHTNNAFQTTELEKSEYDSRKRRESSTYINFRSQPSNQTLKSGMFLARPQNASSSSSYSTSSLDTSPLMSLKKRQQTPPRRTTIVRPKAALNKTTPLSHERRPSLVLESDSSSIDKTKRNSSDTIIIKNYDPGVVSPKSYLSMPSVKSFPRGNIPEPLNKVLEPVSVLHLDITDDDTSEYLEPKHRKFNTPLTRHGSLSAIEDPGVIGPVVWSAYCKKLQNGSDEKLEEIKLSNNSRMRKRFHDLLDETFSLFGSRRESPIEDSRPISLEVKSHSAMTNRPGEEPHLNVRPRPKTSDPRRPLQVENEPPRGAWATNTPSPLSRPLSAGPFRRTNLTPEIDINRVLVEGTLPPNDPAVPLIAAIKTELKKCSLPGSTTNLVE